jgi:hypothetical protein
MVEHVPIDQTSPKMNKDENIWVVVHMTWELAAQKENMLLLREIYLLANSTLVTCALEAILMIRPCLADW